MTEKTVIGRAEWCAFPNLNVPAIKARVDSGAKTSSIHAFDIEPFKQGRQSWVRFNVHPLIDDAAITITCEQRVVDKRMVRSSSGEAELRYVIKTPLKLGNQIWSIEVTLSNRDSMGHRMLLGRSAMSGRLIIDPSLNCTLGQLRKRDLKAAYKKAGVKIASTLAL